MKTRISRVPATTNNVTKGIVNFLLAKGHSASRINTTGILEPIQANDRAYELFSAVINALKRMGIVLGRYRKSGARSGYLDISACLRLRISPGQEIGVFVAIDVKTPGDRLRPEQEAFIEEVKAAGGYAFTVATYGEFVEWYQKSVFKDA